MSGGAANYRFFLNRMYIVENLVKNFSKIRPYVRHIEGLLRSKVHVTKTNSNFLNDRKIPISFRSADNRLLTVDFSADVKLGDHEKNIIA